LIFNKINIYDDLNKYEGIPILGKIPKIKSKNNDYKGLLIYNDTGQNWVNEYYKESYKLLRTEIISSLNNDKNDGRGKVIMITSPIPKEGKSILSANIAISLSEAGYSVLMVDLNQNYPSQESIFDANSIIGLSDLLIEKGSGNDVANSTNIDGLSLITPGSKKYDLSGLLTSEKLTRLIDELRSKYDYILFDSNSIMLSSDSLAVGQKIDGIILILRAGFSKKDAVTKVIQKIKDNNIDLLGIILNCASPNRKYRKYYKS